MKWFLNKVSTWICCSQHYSVLQFCLFLHSAVLLHCALFMFFFFRSCMSYAKIELFSRWNKQNVLNDFPPAFSVGVFLNFQIDGTFESYILSIIAWACLHCWHDCLLMCQEQVEWECKLYAERQHSGMGTHTHTHTRQVCTAYVVTWCL